MAGSEGQPPGEELIGRSLSGYRIESRLGSGATGVVFRAKHPDQDRRVALKVLHDNLGSISSLKRRFEREARVLAKLDHPNVVYITDFGVVDGHTFIAMELLEGQTLEQLLEDQPIDLDRALRITKQILAGLAFAHARQVVHRDLKPANVYLCKSADGTDQVKLLDFGLAKMLSIDDLSQDGTLTRKGRIVGTPAYMAPEQITGVSLDVRADVYALGVLLYELLADRRPFLSERRSELLRAHLLEPVPPLADARKGLAVHPDLEAIVRKALAKDPAHRYADATEMLAAIEALPPHPAKIVKQRRDGDRHRTGATSEIISSNERRAVSEAAGLPLEPTTAKTQTASASAPGPLTPPANVYGHGDPREDVSLRQNAAQIRRELSSRPPSPAAPRRRGSRGPSTPMLYATALALFAIAAVLWLTLGRS
ncbi:serine/threonine-protein kinase [Sandaracinus amylolyticus]|uniref:serine/threonine-protein kinase n=1 Tax=Sandaracinus amylolyticus TaxID=927083 RepID=UPI001F2BA4BD|nr:serine/threonine-protein kinase [Sandaracinus amylolyticus]UJR81206.1 Serine/threonine protein kinase PrkC, regulator of stationary phase [Sandaracinus amylolyticus]